MAYGKHHPEFWSSSVFICVHLWFHSDADRGEIPDMSSDPEYDAFELRKLYEPLRVVDVCDALDGIGYFDLTLMDAEVRPLWLGMKFWGVALTLRCVPSNRPMRKLDTTEEIVNSHGIWFREVGNVGTRGLVRPGHVIVTTETGLSTRKRRRGMASRPSFSGSTLTRLGVARKPAW